MLTRLEVRSTRDQLKALRRLSATDGSKTAKLMREAIDEFLSGDCATNLPIQIEPAAQCDLIAIRGRQREEPSRK